MTDITAVHAHALLALYPAAAGLLTLADPGYEHAGIVIRIPVWHSQPAGPRYQ